MWNDLRLKCPAYDLCLYDLQETTILQELPTLVDLLKTSSEVFTHYQPISEEIQVFQNVREKYRRILHSEKCLLLLQRVGTYLHKIVSLNISKTYLDLAVHLQRKVENQSSPLYLPSRQQLEYVLLRTQSAAKLVCELLHYSKEAFCYLIQRLRMGQLILNLTMATSVTARLNILFRDILVQIFDIYKRLYTWLGKLKKGDANWPKPLDLPEDLESWLNLEASELLKPKEVAKSEVTFLSRFFEKQEKDTESLELDNDNGDQCVIIEEANHLHLENPDVGEVISRPKKAKKKMTRETKTQLLEKIQNIDTLERLMGLWQDLHKSHRAVMKEILKPSRKKLIKRCIFSAWKKLKGLKRKDLPADVKEKRMSAILQRTRSLLTEHLGLTDIEAASSSLLSVEDLKPVKKLKDLRILYNTLHEMLQSTQQSEQCEELEKQFRLRRDDVKRLIINEEKKIARKLIFITSKEFLSRFKKPAGLSTTAASTSTIQTINELKIAKTLEEFEILYKNLCEIFSSTQQYEKLKTLKKKYKQKIEIIMPFINNGNKKMSRRLIVRGSKEFLERNFFKK